MKWCHQVAVSQWLVSKVARVVLFWIILCFVPQWSPYVLLPVQHEDPYPFTPTLGGGGARWRPAVPVWRTLLHVTPVLPPTQRPVQVHDRVLDQLCQDRVKTQHAHVGLPLWARADHTSDCTGLYWSTIWHTDQGDWGMNRQPQGNGTTSLPLSHGAPPSVIWAETQNFPYLLNFI